MESYKTRLVIKGFKEECGIDCQDTFTHVARLTSI
jgi:hypothetical protein